VTLFATAVYDYCPTLPGWGLHYTPYGAIWGKIKETLLPPCKKANLSGVYHTISPNNAVRGRESGVAKTFSRILRRRRRARKAARRAANKGEKMPDN